MKSVKPRAMKRLRQADAFPASLARYSSEGNCHLSLGKRLTRSICRQHDS